MHTPIPGKQSLFIAVEGIDFSGKTTLIEGLRRELNRDEFIRGYFDQIIYTKEPNSGASDLCRRLRQMAVEGTEMADITRALIFFANRSEHVSSVIQPARSRGGCLIICDRFYLSTLVYQIRDNIRLRDWARLTQSLISSAPPDLTYLIRINRGLFLRRYGGNGGREHNDMDLFAYNRFDELTRLYEGYMVDGRDPNVGPIEILEGSDGGMAELVARVHSDIRSRVRDFLEDRSRSTRP